ncbi:hypothetical protein TWF481_006886 [Arthrobotrys musiformis]|uniref:Uncharacterized protein n=1 Tax=Arthrobotrys musiformis TaxID=47236 RepID=A0AAV9W9T3_9PEZI
MSSPETRGSAAAAAAALRRQSYNSSFGPMDSRKLSLFPATPSRSSSRASSIRYCVPTRASELNPIHQDDSISTRFSRSGIYRSHSSASTITPQRPTFGVARSASVNMKRRGSQTYLRRTQSLRARGEPVYTEQPFRIEEKPGFLPASSRPGQRVPALPMPRTLRDPDALGTKRTSGRGRRFPASLRINFFEKARWLGRRVSQPFRRPKGPFQNVPVQQVHSDTKHYGYRMSSGYSDAEGSQYADTVIHHRLWENQSYTTSLDNQEDYFTRAPPSEVDDVSPSARAPVRLPLVETIPEAEEPEPAREAQRGFTPFTHPTDLNGVDSRRVYSALMKSLTQKFSNRGTASETIMEEAEPQEEEPRPSRLSNENARPSRVSREKSPEGRKPLFEIAPRANNTIAAVEEEDSAVPPTPIINIGVKRIRSDDALFSQIAQQHEVWQEEAGGSGGDSDDAVAVAALRQLSISNAVNVEKEREDMASQTRYRTASGKFQENKLKDDEGGELEESEKIQDDHDGMEPVFI